MKTASAVWALTLFLTLTLTAAAAHAQTAYPSKPIRIVVPSTPGGSVDTITRMLGPRLTERWSQQIIVDNRSGAGGIIAAEHVAKSPADGYTLIMGTVAAFATNVSLRRKLPYDPVKDFAPVSLVATQNLVLLIHPSIPATNVKQLVTLARAKPGDLAFASAGNGTGGHLSGELFKMLTGINVLHVPYKGVAPAMIDVISGQVSMTFASILSSLPQVRADKLRALAVTSEKRSPAIPGIPTMMESGVTGYESETWYGLLAPAGTPPEIVNRLSSGVTAIVRQTDIMERLSGQGAEPVGSSPPQFSKFIQAEIAKWAKVIKAAGLQPE